MNGPEPLPGGVRRENIWLLPSNRGKLRNLISLSLRNLSLDTPPAAAPNSNGGRRRGKTIDDDAIPQTLQSPAKLLAVRERTPLEHSRSSSDLRSVAEDDGSPVKGSKGKEVRPQGRVRRRSTLEWANATPQRRQERLERVRAERMADVFFSVHIEGLKDPIYVSETVPRTMNPTFRHVDFSACAPGVLRLERVLVKVWVRRAGLEGWRQLMELDVELAGLQFLGKNLESIQQPIPQNAVLFHMTDGIYIPPTSLTSFLPPPQPSRTTNARALPTSSFDALLRLAKLDDSIQDALTTRNKLAADLETLLQSHKPDFEARDRVAEGEDRLKTLAFAQSLVSKQLAKARTQLAEKRTSLQARKTLMTHDLEHRSTQTQALHTALPALPALREERTLKRRAIHAQRRRICETLQSIYPLSPIPGQSLAFTIASLRLPNASDLESSPQETVAAALGHVSHVLMLLAHYLRHPLPYALTPRGSTSLVTDTLSKLKTSNVTDRTYPLYLRGVPRFRFEYAVFLLNKDIQVLLEDAFGVRVLDVRQTLPNLKYLLYVATAGEGELPARKAGGVRGLATANPGGAAAAVGMRSASEDSVGSALSGLLWHGGKMPAHGKEAANGKPRGAVESLRALGGRGG